MSVLKEELIQELAEKTHSSRIILKDLESEIEFEIEEVRTDPEKPHYIIIGFLQ